MASSKKLPKRAVDKLTGTWARRFDLNQEPDVAGQPYVDILQFKGKDPITGKVSTTFAAIFDNGSGVTGKTYKGVYNGTKWSYKDDFIAIYKDTNSSGRLEAGDKFLGSYNSGEDFGGLQGTMSSGTFRLDNNNILRQYDQNGGLISQGKIPVSLL